jgi:Resolvase, N terminal domain
MTRSATSGKRHERVRCAIYTRKSSEQGLEEQFNSLSAQREACEAFIDSQRHEGWVCLRAAYDDGGFSGATMDRPALQRLLADIAAGRVDTIVVYKIDRLTRSLADFVKIVEILDARGASFVSVTQQFNTTTSMGRYRSAALGCGSGPAGRQYRRAQLRHTDAPAEPARRDAVRWRGQPNDADPRRQERHALPLLCLSPADHQRSD